VCGSPEENEAWLKKNEATPDGQSAIPALSLTLPPGSSINEKNYHDQSGGASEMPKGKSLSRQDYGSSAVYVKKSRSGNSRYYLDYFDNGERIQRVSRRAVSFEDAYAELREAVESMFRSEVGSLVRSECLLRPCDMDRREKFGPEFPTPVTNPESVN
jgi:hypothetical protein